MFDQFASKRVFECFLSHSSESRWGSLGDVPLLVAHVHDPSDHHVARAGHVAGVQRHDGDELVDPEGRARAGTEALPFGAGNHCSFLLQRLHLEVSGGGIQQKQEKRKGATNGV